MKHQPHQNFIVRADFFGEIASNQKISFWFSSNRGILQSAGKKLEYRPSGAEGKNLEVDMNKVVKVRKLSLKPGRNPWIAGMWGSPYWLLFWNPFWNKCLINITYLGPKGMPRELFFKLKTGRITDETMEILKSIHSIL